MMHTITKLGLVVLVLLSQAALAAKTDGAKEEKGAQGIFYATIPFPSLDGTDEFRPPSIWNLNADGTVTIQSQDPNDAAASYWTQVDKNTVRVKTLIYRLKFIDLTTSVYTVGISEGELTTVDDWATFEGEVWGKEWDCPDVFGGPSNFKCPDPVTTVLPPDNETFQGGGFQIIGSRMSP